MLLPWNLLVYSLPLFIGKSVTIPFRYDFVCTCSACSSPPLLKDNSGSDTLEPSQAKVEFEEIMTSHLARLRELWQKGGNKVFQL